MITLVSDSSCDLNQYYIDMYKVNLVPFSVTFDQVTYYKENIDINNEQFYNKLENENVFPKTSLPSMQSYIDIFKESFEKGNDVVCICLSSELSGSYVAAINAKNCLIDDYPDRKIVIIDSKQATTVQGFLVMKAGELIKKGCSINEIEENIISTIEKGNVFFSVETLEYLQKGGRIGKTSATVGTVLNVKPVIQLKEGKVVPFTKVRGTKKATQTIVSKIQEEINSSENYTIIVLSANEKEKANMLKEKIESDLNLKIDYPIFDVGVTIGSHIGKAFGAMIYKTTL